MSIKMDKIKEELLRYFFEDPEKEFYVRELAKATQKSPTTISKYLNEFTKEGFLVSLNKYGHLFFKANQSKKFKDLKLHFNISLLRNSGLIEYLEEEFNHPDAIVLFGSFAKAENNKNSDIDILVISPVKKEISLEKFEKKLNHKIQLFRHSAKELPHIKNKGLLNNFINGIVLEGYMEVIK